MRAVHALAAGLEGGEALLAFGEGLAADAHDAVVRGADEDLASANHALTPGAARSDA